MTPLSTRARVYVGFGSILILFLEIIIGIVGSRVIQRVLLGWCIGVCSERGVSGRWGWGSILCFDNCLKVEVAWGFLGRDS